MGTLLDQMVVLRLQRMKPLPARINKAALREYAQPEQRAQLAALLRRIAAFAEGMRAMEKCVNLPWVIYCRGKLKVVLDNCFAQLAVSVIVDACMRQNGHPPDEPPEYLLSREHGLSPGEPSMGGHHSTGAVLAV